MKKLILAFTLATSVLVVSACSDKEVSDASDVIASTKAGNITKEDLYEEMKDSIGSEVLENLILLKAIENEFKVTDKELEEALATSKETYGENFEMFLAQQNITEEVFEKKILFSLHQQKMIESLEEATDEDINAEYEKMKKEVHARHILVDDKKTAEEVIAKLADGGDFAALAGEYSTEPNADESGGDLGWFGAGKMVVPFEEAAFALEKNKISEPVKTIHGYHVIEVLDTRDVEIEQTLEELKPEIEEQIKAKRFEDKLILLLNNADVDIKEDQFKSVLKGYLTTEEAK